MNVCICDVLKDKTKKYFVKKKKKRVINRLSFSLVATCCQKKQISKTISVKVEEILEVERIVANYYY